MKHKYNIPDLLGAVTGYKGVPYSRGFFSMRPDKKFVGDDFMPGASAIFRQEFVKGTRLYKQDALGQWYFMPVFVKHPSLPEGEMELPHAVISVTGSKSIVETPLVGRKGSVKELVSVNDYKISLAAFISSGDGSYPADSIIRMQELFEINETVEVVSALTDLILGGGQAVITDIGYPSTPGVEDGQAVTIECVTDQDFELDII